MMSANIVGAKFLAKKTIDKRAACRKSQKTTNLQVEYLPILSCSCAMKEQPSKFYWTENKPRRREIIDLLDCIQFQGAGEAKKPNNTHL